MAMVNMQMSAEEAKETTTPDAGNAPKYPYGLCLYLDDDALAKLGITDLPPVGTQLTLTANVTVQSVGMNQQQDGDKESRCELQITDMALDAASGPSVESRLWPAK